MEKILLEYLKKSFSKNYVNFKKNHNKKYEKLYDEISKNLFRELNNFHQVEFSQLQWKIIIGPWLDNILNIYFYYDFNLKQKNLNKNYMVRINKQTIKGFDNFRNNFLHYNNFVKNLNSSDLHCSAIKIILSNKEFNLPKFKKISSVQSNKLKLFYLIFLKVLSPKKLVLHSKSRLRLSDQIKLMIKSKFKIFPIPVMEDIFRFKFFKSNFDRINFFEKFNKKDKNIKIIKFLLFYMPSSYLENFSFLQKLGKKYLKQPRKFYTDSSHLFDEILKIQLSNWKNSKSTKIVIGQHGGNTRIYRDSLLNYNDFKFCDYFATWGYIKNRSKEICIPSIRLNNFYKINRSFKIKRVYDFCYILKPLTNKGFVSHFHENIRDNYIQKKFFFFKHIKSKFIVKSYHEKNRYKNQLSNYELAKLFGIERNKVNNNFNIIFKSEILIFDYLSTMIFEVINLNKPIIVIIDKKDHFLSTFGKTFLNNLEELGILFSSHTQILNLIKSNPNFFKDYAKKWKEINKQNKIKIFCRNYAYISKNYLDDWTNFLIKK